MRQLERALELGINVLLLKMCFLQDIGLAKIGRKEEKCITQRKKLKRKRKKEKKRSNMLGVAYMLSWESRWELI
jgi:hypothetical protein